MLESSKVPALTRAIDILNLIARIGPCSAATIIDTLGIPKSTAYLLLNELRRQRFLSLDHPGKFLFVDQAGGAFRSCVKQDGSPGTGSTAFDATDGYHRAVMSPGIIDNGSAYYILKVESSATISVRSHEGKSLSLYRSGIGKCLLARQPAAVQQSIIEGLVWEQATPTTITHPQQLHEELARIRRQGWSYDNGEDYADVRCVAAPVFNANNELTAAISVVGTRLQINEEYRDYLAGKAIACAGDISRLLGWKSPFDLQAS